MFSFLRLSMVRVSLHSNRTKRSSHQLQIWLRITMYKMKPYVFNCGLLHLKIRLYSFPNLISMMRLVLNFYYCLHIFILFFLLFLVNIQTTPLLIYIYYYIVYIYKHTHTHRCPSFPFASVLWFLWLVLLFKYICNKLDPSRWACL